LKTITTMIGFFATLIFLAWFFLINNQNQNSLSQGVTQLEHIGDECVAISEKAIIGMTPVVEFQKLELLSRKAYVLKRCMADKGFHENPAWQNYAKPLAELNASEQNISFDEAIETMRKADMLLFKKQPKRPLYWISTENSTF